MFMWRGICLQKQQKIASEIHLLLEGEKKNHCHNNKTQYLTNINLLKCFQDDKFMW